jgi:uncharacterized integral membrane protein
LFILIRAVEVDYLFGTAEWPLILVILGSVLMGALIVFSAGIPFSGSEQIINLNRPHVNDSKDGDNQSK